MPYARTLLALGWKYTTPGLLLIVVAKLGTLALHGWETAVLSLENWFFNAGLPVVTVLAAIFLYNLWLAPLRMARAERGAALQTAQNLIPADAEVWGKYGAVKLYEAACLWCGFEPDLPTENKDIKKALSRLRHAAALGELKVVQDADSIGEKVSEGLTGTPSTWRPKDDQKVLTVELRKYAEQIGDTPPSSNP